MEAHDSDRFDKWLDSALEQYGNVQPRAGLESRIMANLEVRSRLVVRRRWTLAFASAAVACIVLVALWHSPTSRETRQNIATVSSPNPENTAARLTTSLPHPRKQEAHSAIRRHARRTDDSVNARAQKFPSPRPLTDRELALAAYAKSFPKEAERIAQEQETFEQEMEQAQLELENRTQLLNQER